MYGIWCVQPSPLEQLSDSGKAIGPHQILVQLVGTKKNMKPRIESKKESNRIAARDHANASGMAGGLVR
jgi:hypothetical protein